MINLTFKSFGTILAALLLSFSVLSNDNGKEYNVVDDQGKRQGYWIIKGYMSGLEAFSPNSTVEEGEYRDNKKEGVWKRYHANGEIKSKITYQNNIPRGPYSIYYDNGITEEEGQWQDNKNVGRFVRFYKNGNPQQEFEFGDNGMRNGLQKYFHENGVIALEVDIVNGKENGTMVRYHEDGSIKEKKTMENGVLKKGSTRTFAPHTYAQSISPKTTEKPTKTAAIKSSEEKPNKAFSFKPNGYNVLYDANQQITQIGEFKSGRLWDGKWNRYNHEGLLIRVEIYKQGQFIGTGLRKE